ncbi:hypothetical protein GOBAR_AA04325 [Gossypium barbadense]|uniref:Uncharacterized protein n=1 Tax=Gossypium barbadense TaxID=3634 RepID=A0A2P5YL02_GOSBA|nr:hypothetical protein GOBAR_AA04325 [Gossypium barbadense]
MGWKCYRLVVGRFLFKQSNDHVDFKGLCMSYLPSIFTGNEKHIWSEDMLSRSASIFSIFSRFLASDSIVLFHPSCMEMTIEEAKRLDHFLCSDCTSEDAAKRSMNTFRVSASLEPKVRAFMFMV